jgi:hypothetical protein
MLNFITKYFRKKEPEPQERVSYLRILFRDGHSLSWTARDLPEGYTVGSGHEDGPWLAFYFWYQNEGSEDYSFYSSNGTSLYIFKRQDILRVEEKIRVQSVSTW